MSDKNEEKTPSVPPLGNEHPDAGYLHIEDVADEVQSTEPVPALPGSDSKPATPLSEQALERIGSAEHLAARRPLPTIDPATPEHKKKLSLLRTEVTRILTGLRWEHKSVEETAKTLVPLLNVGPVTQWQNILVPFLFEIDRGGALLPAWLYMIDQGDPADLPADVNPADTTIGRARRFAILMLGNYRTLGISGNTTPLRFTGDGALAQREFNSIEQLLGYLAIDPNTSLYATQALVKHATIPAMQALIEALAEAKGWAKVDIIEGCLALQQEQFYDLILASGLKHTSGLENYIAIPIYRFIPLERYLQNTDQQNTLLRANAAVVIGQVLQDNSNPGTVWADGKLPVVFERHLPTLAAALFEAARRDPSWQYTLALHRLGIFVGRYWSDISRGAIKDARIIQPVYQTVPMMPELERWMDGPGRDILLKTLTYSDDETGQMQAAKLLGEMRDPRAIGPIIGLLEKTRELRGYGHAQQLSTYSDTLGMMGDRRAALPLIALVQRILNTAQRSKRAKRADYLLEHDPDFAGSVVYTSVLRNCAVLGDTEVIEGMVRATVDVDPMVRTQALEAIRRLDPRGEQNNSRIAVRELLNDPRESIVRSASQIVLQYRDTSAIPTLKQLKETRPELGQIVDDALRQLH